MIFGNIKTFKSCGMVSADLEKYIELLKTITPDIKDGRYELSDGAYYNVCTVAKQGDPAEKVFESHKKFIDIQFVFEGSEQMEYADLQTLPVTQPYAEDGDCALEKGEGVLLTVNTGDFVVFCPEDAHKPGCGNGTSRKVIVKVPVK